MRSRTLAALTALMLLASACSSEEQRAEPLRDLGGDIAQADSIASIPETASPEAATATTTTSEPELESEPEAETEVPAALPLADENPLCVDIDVAIDAALASDEEQLAAVGDSNRLVGRHLPEDLQGPRGTALPLVDGLGFIDLWTRLDAHTTETCGLPFFTALMGTMMSCLELPEGAEIPYDSGPCEDPRVNPEALLSTDEVLELLSALGSTVETSFTEIS